MKKKKYDIIKKGDNMADNKNEIVSKTNIN